MASPLRIVASLVDLRNQLGERLVQPLPLPALVAAVSGLPNVATNAAGKQPCKAFHNGRPFLSTSQLCGGRRWSSSVC